MKIPRQFNDEDWVLLFDHFFHANSIRNFAIAMTACNTNRRDDMMVSNLAYDYIVLAFVCQANYAYKQ